jgi:predicted AAA+ superfamily ATPase
MTRSGRVTLERLKTELQEKKNKNEDVSELEDRIKAMEDEKYKVRVSPSSYT